MWALAVKAVVLDSMPIVIEGSYLSEHHVVGDRPSQAAQMAQHAGAVLTNKMGGLIRLLTAVGKRSVPDALTELGALERPLLLPLKERHE